MQDKRTGTVSDLVAFLRGQPRRNLWFAATSVILTAILMFGFLFENRSGYVERSPTLVYVESWSAQRTRDQAAAAQRVTMAEMRLKAAEGDYARARTALALSMGKSDRQAASAAVARTEAAYMERLEELRAATESARTEGAFAPAVAPLVAPGQAAATTPSPGAPTSAMVPRAAAAAAIVPAAPAAPAIPATPVAPAAGR